MKKFYLQFFNTNREKAQIVRECEQEEKSVIHIKSDMDKKVRGFQFLIYILSTMQLYINKNHDDGIQEPKISNP